MPGKIPLYRETPGATEPEAGPTYAALLQASGRSVIVAPACADITDAVLAQLRDTNVLFFDGTLFTDDEMIEAGLGAKTGTRMGHVPISGPRGTLGRLADLPARRIFLHINNTNPILLSEFTATAASRGRRLRSRLRRHGGTPVSDMLTADELEAKLREIGAKRYHIHHPFHRMLHTGKCSKGQVQAWALNRYYYQAMIPLKDGSLIGRCEDSALRREWRKRLEDHDGDDHRPGGIERWLKLTDGLGLDRADVISTRLLLPATRFAVQAYVRYVRERSMLEAVASCLTEMFSPQIISERMAGMLANYDYITPEILSYFDKRPPQAQRDAVFALDWVKQHARTPEQQQQVLDTLTFKCDVLWSMMDALHYAYVTPGLISPGAFVPRPEER